MRKELGLYIKNEDGSHTPFKSTHSASMEVSMNTPLVDIKSEEFSIYEYRVTDIKQNRVTLVPCSPWNGFKDVQLTLQGKIHPDLVVGKIVRMEAEKMESDAK